MAVLNEERLKVFGEFTAKLARLSKCTERKVAAIAINEDGTQIYSIGINGGPKGGIDCLCTLGGKYSCIHAEAQCIAKCTTVDTSKVMICTLSPCVTCASLIVNSGFKAVYYIEEWKDTTGIAILKDAGVKVHKLDIIDTHSVPSDEVIKVLCELLATDKCRIHYIDPAGYLLSDALLKCLAAYGISYETSEADMDTGMLEVRLIR